MLLCACSSSPSSEVSVAPIGTATPQTSAPFDVSAVVRQVHFAFRAEGTGWSGGHSTYGVRVDGEEMTLTAVAREAAVSRLGAEPRSDASLSLGAMRWQRGGRKPSSANARALLEPTGHLSFTRDGFAETVRNTEEGVRQEWTFASAPAGEGDLTLTVPAKGLAYVSASEKGLLFEDARTKRGFWYGHTAWVDAEGRSTALMARHVDGAIQFKVPASMLAQTVFPARVAPVISPELELDPLFTVPHAFEVGRLSIAWSGSNYFVAWEDDRKGTTHVIGTRVSVEGKALDPEGVQLSTGEIACVNPRVASSGTSFLVVWETFPRDFVPSSVMAALVPASGDATAITQLPSLGNVPGWHSSPAVASNGEDYLVTWSNDAPERSALILAARVSRTGTLLDASPLTVSSGPGMQYSPSVASNGTDYLVAWDDMRSGDSGSYIRASRVTHDGRVLDAQPLQLPEDAANDYFPAVASNGTDYLVIWSRYFRSRGSQIFGARVTSEGEVLDPAGLAVTDLRPETDSSRPSVVSNGTDYLAAWGESSGPFGSVSELRVARVTSRGTVETPGGSMPGAGPGADRPALAFNGTNYFVVWRPVSRWEVLGLRLDASGVPLDVRATVLVRKYIDDAWTPAIAFNGSHFLVVWRDGWTRSEGIIGTRVAPDGTVLDPGGLLVDTYRGRAGLYRPAVASDGKDFFVAWQREREEQSLIFGTRVSAEGRVDTPGGQVVGAGLGLGSSSPSLSSNGEGYLLAFLERGPDGMGVQLSARRISKTGAPIDTTSRVLCDLRESSPDFVNVASNGTDYLAVWEDQRGGTRDIYGTRVMADGTVSPQDGFVISNARDNQRAPAVASDGTDYLVAWGDFRNGNSSDVYGARVSGVGQVLDPEGIAISTEVRWQYRPSITFLGRDYFVVWEDMRVSTPNPNIYGARVTRQGLVREEQGLLISGDVDREDSPVVASVGDGASALVVYVRGYSVRQSLGRRVTFGDHGLPTAMSSTVATPEDTALELQLSAKGGEDADLVYEILTPPAHGELTGEGRLRTYTPLADFAGTDSFTFRVSEGGFVSGIATVTVEVSDVNDAPTVPEPLMPEPDAEWLTGEVLFQWEASRDVEGDALRYELEIFQDGARIRLLSTTETNLVLSEAEALPPGAYSWTVKAVDAQGLASEPSMQRSLVVEKAIEGPKNSESGCGCNPTSGATPAAPLLLAMIGLLARGAGRRRR